MSFYKNFSYYANKDQVFFMRPTFVMSSAKMKLSENADSVMVPRFTLKDAEIFNDFPTNEEVRYSPELIMKAIKWGMILRIQYKGAEDERMEGHERLIYPMVYGKSKDGKEILRGYHLNGWSVSHGGKIEKEWRMFRTDRILSMAFTGAFFRLAPEGYNMDDKGIHKILAKADFTDIRNLQQELLNKNQIDTQERTILTRVNDIEVKDLNWNLKLFNPFENNVIPKKDARNIRVTFAKPLLGTGLPIAIIGISVNTNTSFNLKIDGKVVGRYKSLKWKMANNIQNDRTMGEMQEFKAYMFLKSN
jgi:hypothetical protein